MMQRDEDVGKIANGAPVVLARAMELFVKQLTTTTCDVAVLHGAKTIQATHLKGAIAMVPEAFDFLSDVVETVADLPPPPDLNAMEAELKEKEMDDGANVGGGGAGGKRKKTKASGGSLELGSLGGFGGSLDDAAVEVRRDRRDIDLAQFSLLLQERNVDIARNRLASIDAAPDRATARDQTDAVSGLRDAEDSRDRAKRNPQVAILGYLRSAGLLRLDPEGRLQPLADMPVGEVVDGG